MAMILKEGQVYVDERGTEYSDAYGVIDVVEVDKHLKNARFRFYIYKDQAAREALKIPVTKMIFNVTAEVFDNWFSLAKIEEFGNQFKCAYNFCESYTPKEMDEDMPVYDANWNYSFDQTIWEGDE